MKSICAVICLLVCLSLASLSQAAHLDTSFDFSTLETPHFSIHFHQGLEGIAQRTARIAEEVHRDLTREYLWTPDEKTQLVLIDDSDFANGFATAIPYNTVYLQIVPPSLESTIGEYDDWLRVLITHEYAHIVTLDPARGYWKVARSIFGKPVPGLDYFTELLFLVTAPPNSFLPRWWHEGMATWAETEYNGQGRGNSTFYDMIFRMAVARGNLPGVDRANGDVPFWPDGSLPYIYGYRLQQYLADTYGKEALGELSRAHSGRFPYLIEAPAQRLFRGRSYERLYRDMLAALEREQRERIDLLSRVPFTPTKTVAGDGERLTNPRFSPDGSRFAYTRRDPHDHTSIVIAGRDGKKAPARVRRQTSDGSICWSPDGKTLYFTQAEISNGFDTYQDLYAYDLAGERTARLTKGERLGAVDLSPDGGSFAAVRSARGSQNLVLLERTGEAGVSLPRQVTSYREERVSSPRWSPDGAAVSYALRDNTGHSSIRLYQAKNGEDRLLFSAGHTLEYPVWSRDGSVLFYVSDQTGVFNLFAYDLKKGESYQVSHLLGGALQPDLAPDGATMLFSSYDARGFRIESLAADRSAWVSAPGPVLPPPRALPAPAVNPGRTAAAADQPAASPGPAVAQGGASTPLSERVSPVPERSRRAVPERSRGAVPELPKATVAPLDPAPGASLPDLPATPYRSLGTLLPRFWLPRLSYDGAGLTYGLFTAGADVLGYHAYVLSADYSPNRERGYFDFIYRNDSFYPTLYLDAHSEPLLYANLQRRGDYWEQHRALTMQVSYPINFLESRYLLSGGYQLRDQQALSALDAGDTFRGVTVFRGRRDNAFLGFTFDNALKYPYSISPEEGRIVSLGYRRFDRALGSDEDFSEYTGNYQEFLTLPWGGTRHQTLYLRLSGAASDGGLKFGQQPFQIGGPPSDLNPYPLRGYRDRSVTGKYVATGTVEYRMPFFYPMTGFGTAPAFLEKLHGALFLDAGKVWDDHNPFADERGKVGAGFEVRLDVTVGYWLKITPSLGFAHGFSSGGENQLYLNVYLNM